MSHESVKRAEPERRQSRQGRLNAITEMPADTRPDSLFGHLPEVEVVSDDEIDRLVRLGALCRENLGFFQRKH